jgi:hypothetical protein
MTDRRYFDGTVIESGRPLGATPKGGKWIAFLNFMQDGDSFLMDKSWLDNHGYPAKTEQQMMANIARVIACIRNASKNPKCSNRIVTRRINAGMNGANAKLVGYRIWAFDKQDEFDDKRIIACSLCGKDIKPQGEWYQGHNAEPIKEGRCCDDCNLDIVLPARLSNLPDMQPAYSVNTEEN